MKTDEHMKQDPDDPEYFYYDGPDVWFEGEDHLAACAITWDDMWLTIDEVILMMYKISDKYLTKQRGAIWQQMRIVWRDNIEHFVLEVPLYGA